MSLRSQQWRDVLDQGGVQYAFEMARDENDTVSYGFTILARVEAVGPIMAACEDVADALGGLDYDEAILATWATVDQWEAVANAIDPTNRLGFQVRLAAHTLRHKLNNADLDLEALADLVTLASLESELTNTALRWIRASEEQTEEQFWSDHEVRLRQVFRMSSSLKADLRSRGELGLDDELLLGENEADG
ncbi:MAG: hypothetical protein QOF60_1415 [Actinomycetota bacterium]|nr:hypothetical protein [Actinomycetota bacterium]